MYNVFYIVHPPNMQNQNKSKKNAELIECLCLKWQKRGMISIRNIVLYNRKLGAIRDDWMIQFSIVFTSNYTLYRAQILIVHTEFKHFLKKKIVSDFYSRCTNAVVLFYQEWNDQIEKDYFFCNFSEIDTLCLMAIVRTDDESINVVIKKWIRVHFGIHWSKKRFN